ncbi:chromosomal region maintenance protein CRM1 (nucleomorph) [Guillardia theta]|uniref:Chromosomal region maintenance protein CRM1 n=1 Tax=Guillardia theta TaxID=55529 RepID=Q98RX5_GUITH|nr:chromosomal region maintenance protein CRM1 [Guillardia theta]AAK39825.1 chromosomal region maintenance protein CRM1 [Guillardia theta]
MYNSNSECLNTFKNEIKNFYNANSNIHIRNVEKKLLRYFENLFSLENFEKLIEISDLNILFIVLNLLDSKIRFAKNLNSEEEKYLLLNILFHNLGKYHKISKSAAFRICISISNIIIKMKNFFVTSIIEFLLDNSLKFFFSEYYLFIVDCILEKFSRKDSKIFKIIQGKRCKKAFKNLLSSIFNQSASLFYFNKKIIKIFFSITSKILRISKKVFVNKNILNTILILYKVDDLQYFSLDYIKLLIKSRWIRNTENLKYIIDNLTLQIQEIFFLSDFKTKTSLITFKFHIWLELLEIFKMIYFKEKFHNLIYNSYFLLTNQVVLYLSCVFIKEVHLRCLSWWNLILKNNFIKKNFVTTFFHKILINLSTILMSKFSKPIEITITNDEIGILFNNITKSSFSTNVYIYEKNIFNQLELIFKKELIDILNIKLKYYIDKNYLEKRVFQSICWCIGSLVNCFSQEEEKTFLVYILKLLLNSCENYNNKNKKAIIVSNIMIIIGSFPRFLNFNIKFLKTVILKLFEFIEESFSGIRDMISFVFYSICRKCYMKILKNEEIEQNFLNSIVYLYSQKKKYLDFRQDILFLKSFSILIKNIKNYSIRTQSIEKIYINIRPEKILIDTIDKYPYKNYFKVLNIYILKNYVVLKILKTSYIDYSLETLKKIFSEIEFRFIKFDNIRSDLFNNKSSIVYDELLVILLKNFISILFLTIKYDKIKILNSNKINFYKNFFERVSFILLKNFFQILNDLSIFLYLIFILRKIISSKSFKIKLIFNSIILGFKKFKSFSLDSKLRVFFFKNFLIVSSIILKKCSILSIFKKSLFKDFLILLTEIIHLGRKKEKFYVLNLINLTFLRLNSNENKLIFKKFIKKKIFGIMIIIHRHIVKILKNSNLDLLLIYLKRMCIELTSLGVNYLKNHYNQNNKNLKAIYSKLLSIFLKNDLPEIKMQLKKLL